MSHIKYKSTCKSVDYVHYIVYMFFYLLADPIYEYYTYTHADTHIQYDHRADNRVPREHGYISPS